jgi:ribonuclease R
MIRVADIPGDYYYYDDDLHRMVGEETGKVFKLGETVKIVVAGVDKLVQTVDFVLEDSEDSEEPKESSEDSSKQSGRRAKKGREHGKRK